MPKEMSLRWGRVKSSIFYSLVKGGIGLLPFGRYAAANWLMAQRILKLQAAIVKVLHGRWVVIPQAVSTWVLPFGLKEPAIQRVLASLLGRADAFIDCGANLGWYSFLASRAQEVQSIIAVEPVWQSVRFIEFIKRLNGIENLRVVKACVSDHDGKASFCSARGRFPEMGYVVASSGDAEGRGVADSQSYTLESIIRMVDPALDRICIKVDVEGHETAVLSSMAPETMRKRVDSVVVEVHLYKFSKPVEELRRVCSLVSVVGPPEFLILSRDLNAGYRRLWWHVTKRYPVLQLPVPEVLELVKAHSLPELYVLARRGGIS